MALWANTWEETPAPHMAPFEHLFISEYARVVAVAARVLGDPHEAEDVAQDVFCQFYRTHSPDAPFAGPWLYRAAAHAALNRLRGQRRRVGRESRDAVERDRLQGPGQDPQEALEQKEQRLEIQRSLAQLPHKSAAVLALRYSGLSYAEVASALGVGIGQVGTLLRRAEKALHKEITRGTH